MVEWRNEAEWQSWHDREIEGQVYTFTHLRSFDMEVHRPAKGPYPEFNCTVRVVFDCHVVTEKDKTGQEYDPNDRRHWRDLGGHLRIFEPKRYEHSKCLPEMVSGLASGQVKCYVAKQNNYMVWKPAGADAADPAHYQAFFDIGRPNRKDGKNILILYVQSAYLKDEPFLAQRERFKAFGQICAELCGVVESKKEKAKKAKQRKLKQAKVAA